MASNVTWADDVGWSVPAEANVAQPGAKRSVKPLLSAGAETPKALIVNLLKTRSSI